MYCKYCGKEISDDSKFCQHCGKQIVSVNGCKKQAGKSKFKLSSKSTKIILGCVISLVVLFLGYIIIRNNTIYGRWYYTEYKDARKNRYFISELNIKPNGHWTLTKYRNGYTSYYAGKWEKDGNKYCCGYYGCAKMIKRGLHESILIYDGNCFKRRLISPL